MSTNISPRRISLILGVFTLAFVIIFARTVYLQSVKTRALSEAANLQQQNKQELPAVRGGIFDRNGQELAVGEAAVTLYATPKLVKDRVGTSVQIADLLGWTNRQKDQLITKMSNATGGFEYVARQVPRLKAQKVIDAKLAGIGFFEEERRVYPLKGSAAQLLGYAGTDNRGLAGMEKLYDNTLRGQNGEQVVVRDPLGTPIDVLSLKQEVDGRDVTLTLDSIIQTQAEKVLEKTVKQFAAQGATAIVMNPRTGEIYAMANVPRIDANSFGTADFASQRNRAITDTYEPGSTFKIVTIGGALEDGLVTPTTSFLLRQSIRVADRRIEDAEKRPTERMSTRDILVKSSNVGTITIGMMMGKERLNEWIEEFGFGRPTNIDFPGEVNGLKLAPEDWSGSTIGNVPIGQGIGVTAIQLASSYAALANDGVLIQPHLLKKISGETPPQYQRRRVISAKTARIMRYILGQVVLDEHGTGQLAKIDGYRVAGKTGTANKAEGGIYVKGKYSSSFIGFVPAQNPQLLTLVVVDEPNVPWGGSVAAPAFEEITSFSLQYLAIPPDGVM